MAEALRAPAGQGHRRAESCSQAAVSPVANDNAVRKGSSHQSALPADARAIIRPVERPVTTSGGGGVGRWRLEFEDRSPPFLDPLTGWTGGSDPLAHLSHIFPARRSAASYCERSGIPYEFEGPLPGAALFRAVKPDPATPCRPIRSHR